MVLSINDIQGQWSEMHTAEVWEVSGIVAEKGTRPKGQRKRPIVLNDGPEGVTWGSGNLTGSLEDGVLVWRNRRGEVTYCWEKLEEKAKGMQPARKTGTPEARKTSQVHMPDTDSVRTPSRKNSVEKLTPRSTSSGMSNETTEITAEIGSSANPYLAPLIPTGNLEEQPDDVAVAEMKMLMEMASNRLLVGDVYMSMRYITLAQQVRPLFTPLDGNA
jgi:hypothetical protein